MGYKQKLKPEADNHYQLHVKLMCFVLLAVSEEAKAFFFHSMCNETILLDSVFVGFKTIKLMLLRGKGYPPQPSALADNGFWLQFMDNFFAS